MFIGPYTNFYRTISVELSDILSKEFDVLRFSWIERWMDKAAELAETAALSEQERTQINIAILSWSKVWIENGITELDDAKVRVSQGLAPAGFDEKDIARIYELINSESEHDSPEIISNTSAFTWGFWYMMFEMSHESVRDELLSDASKLLMLSENEHSIDFIDHHLSRYLSNHSNLTKSFIKQAQEFREMLKPNLYSKGFLSKVKRWFKGV
jgi:hypothetical protein